MARYERIDEIERDEKRDHTTVHGAPKLITSGYILHENIKILSYVYLHPNTAIGNIITSYLPLLLTSSQLHLLLSNHVMHTSVSTLPTTFLQSPRSVSFEFRLLRALSFTISRCEQIVRCRSLLSFLLLVLIHIIFCFLSLLQFVLVLLLDCG